MEIRYHLLDIDLDPITLKHPRAEMDSLIVAIDNGRLGLYGSKIYQWYSNPTDKRYGHNLQTLGIPVKDIYQKIWV